MRIDDDLMAELKARAERERISLARLLNRTLRLGMAASAQATKPKRPYREPVARLGVPKLDLGKPWAVVAALDDEDTLERMSRHEVGRR
jgi:hypothetical protein